MKVLILGSTGMLGKALMREAGKRGITAIGLARSYADLCVDISDDKALINAVKDVHPEVIINTVAIVSLASCEKNPCLAYRVNARPVAILSEIARRTDAYLIQISTDHYFTSDRNAKHAEACPVCLVNEYARTKFAAEHFALACPGSLVVRTNIVGFRHKTKQPTFVEWVIATLEKKLPMTLFEDFYTSSINVTQFSRSLFDIVNKREAGILNIASAEVSNKKTFIETIASRLGHSVSHAKVGSVFELSDAPRAESLGLDVGKAENILGYKLPTLNEVVDSLISEYTEISR